MVANLGIINCVNYGDLKSTYNTSVYGVKGRVNIFAGGAVTINRGSVQNVINMGNVAFANLSNLDSGLVQFNLSEYIAGSVQSFRGGLTLGRRRGVGAGTSRIYDSANSGEVLAIAKNYARAGGILAVCLYSEISAGAVPTALLTNDIQDSILSNCINYGRVSGVTETIFEYSKTQIYRSETAYYASSSSGTFYHNRRHGTTSRDLRVGRRRYRLWP